MNIDVQRIIPFNGMQALETEKTQTFYSVFYKLKGEQMK